MPELADEVLRPTDYIVYSKDLSLPGARLAPATSPPAPLFPSAPPSLAGPGPCGVAECAVEAYDFPTGRGLRVRRQVKKGECVLEVPLEQCWSPKRARESPPLSGLHALPDQDVVALHLLAERSKGLEGWNAAHIASLPTTFDMTALWSEGELALLDEELQLTSRKLATQVAGDFAAVVEAVEASGSSLLRDFKIDLEAFRWAKAVLWSRCTDVAVGEVTQRVLVPGFDLANYDAAAVPSHTVCDGKVVLKAYRAHDAGEELCIDYGARQYGAKANFQLLLWHGFVLEDNPFQCLTFEFPVHRSASKRLTALGACMREAPDKGERVIASCSMSLRDPLPSAMVFAAAVCNQLCKPEATSLTSEQELLALGLLVKSLPAAPEVCALPPRADYRRWCAEVLRTMDDRILVAFHAAIQQRQMALSPQKPQKKK